MREQPGDATAITGSTTIRSMSTIREQAVQHHCSGERFEGFVAIDESTRGPKPVVVICPAWNGRDEFVMEKARKLAALGYVGYAADFYGLDSESRVRVGTTPEECGALVTPLVEDRGEVRTRLAAMVESAQKIPGVDPAKVVVIGYCFGGTFALDAARANLEGVVGAACFHGVFTPPDLGPQAPIRAKILACHGWDDPWATPEAVLGFAREMTEAHADWQLHAYGRTKHAFTNPKANDLERGIVYDATADARSWEALSDFLRECAK